jgi:hypothetical protein
MSALARSVLGHPRARRLRGRLLGRRHMLPDFVILGAARSGTTYLLGHLNAHPNVLPGPHEPHFFDSHRYTLGLGWYRLRFPTLAERDARAASTGRSPLLTGESSPSYLADPHAPERLREALPDARLIVLLRDPTARAASHWNWCLRQCGETRSLAEAVEAELGAADRPPAIGPERPTRRNDPLIVRRGLYQEQLERWHGLFPREQLLVLQSERLFREPLAVMQEVWRHLGLPEQDALGRVMRNRNKPGTAYDEAVLERLRAFYRPHNERLAGYLGTPLDWG